MDLASDEMQLGDLLSPLNQSSLAAEHTLGLLDDYLGAAVSCPSPGFSSLKTKDVLSDWLSVDSIHARSEEDAFFGMDWMVEKMDLKLFDGLDSLLGPENMESVISPADLIAALDGSYHLLEDTPCPVVDILPASEPLSYDQSPIGPDQVAPIALFSPPLDSSTEGKGIEDCSIFSISTQWETSTPEHCPSPPPDSLMYMPDRSQSLSVCSELDIECQKLAFTKCEREDEVSDDSGICLSPASYLVSPKQSPCSSMGSPVSSRLSSYLDLPPQNPALVEPGPCSQPLPEIPISVRPKPYDPPTEDKVLAKVKVAGGERKLDKKTKKMEQNKTAATRYRQKKRAEQEAISAECRELEGKNDALQEKVDSLAKEIQYLKDLMEEVRVAKKKQAKSQPSVVLLAVCCI